MKNELASVRVAAELLKKRGAVFIGYITAELEPYSAQQKPDISFVPNDGPNAGKVFFVELRYFEDEKLPRQFEAALREAKAFALEGAEGEFGGFALASNVSLDPAAIDRLAEAGIHFLGALSSGEVLAEMIGRWAYGANERRGN